MAPQTAIRLTPYGVSALSLAVTVLAAFRTVEYALCQVGNRINGFKTSVVDVSVWSRVGGACLAGKANNLVVGPGFNIEPGTIQRLTVRGPDAQLYSRLSQRIEEHKNLRGEWEKKRKETRCVRCYIRRQLDSVAGSGGSDSWKRSGAHGRNGGMKGIRCISKLVAGYGKSYWTRLFIYPAEFQTLTARAEAVRVGDSRAVFL